MACGGKRVGAERPKCSATRRTREVADRAAAEGVVPLEVLLRVMRDHFAAGRYDRAAEVARDAAPYCHPRLSSVEARVTALPVEDMTDAELLSIAASGAA